MGFECGIIGLPNVGKSTIFNALSSAGAESANYPFCTIEPNTGVVPVPDERLNKLAAIAGSAKIIPTAITFVDIAGLVKGASQGEGLGNQFLGHIRSVDALVHVVRCFEDENITHVDGSVSPARDVDVINTELMLADLDSVERRLQKVAKLAKSGDKQAKVELSALEEAKTCLEAGKSLRSIANQENQLQKMGFLTSKPLLYLANVAEEDAALKPEEVTDGHVAELYKLATSEGASVIVISGAVEAEISTLEEEEKKLFLDDIGLSESGLDRLALAGYKLLELITFFTVGPKEAHAWTCPKDATAVDAAGVIHTDFAKGFIRAEVISYDDYLTCGGELRAKEKGLMRLEGKAYQVRDGDIMHFRFNV